MRDADRRRRTGPWLPRLTRIVVAFALACVAGLLALRGALVLADEALATAPLATSSPDRLAQGLVGLAAGVAALALAVVAIRPAVSDVAARTLFVVCAGPAAMLLLAAAVVHAQAPGCAGWRPDEARLRDEVAAGGSDEAIKIAAGMVRCDRFEGASRARVRALLGSPQQGFSGHASNQWTWELGTVNDTFGLGDGEYLTIRFYRDRVSEADLQRSD